MTKKYFEKACGKISASIARYGLTRTPVKEDGFVNYKSCIVISRMITMDWIAFIAFIAGIILVIIGIALLFNLPAIMHFFEKIVGLLCVLLGVVSIVFGWKLFKSV